MALAYAVQKAAQSLQYAPALLRLRHFNTSKSLWQEPKHPQPVPLSKLKDSFNDGTSITYLEELERRFQNDPASVDRTWASFFNSLGKIHTCPAWANSLARASSSVTSSLLLTAHGVPGETIAEAYDAFEKGQTMSPLATAAVSKQSIQESMRLVLLVRAFQVRWESLCTLPYDHPPLSCPSCTRPQSTHHCRFRSQPSN